MRTLKPYRAEHRIKSGALAKNIAYRLHWITGDLCVVVKLKARFYLVKRFDPSGKDVSEGTKTRDDDSMPCLWCKTEMEAVDKAKDGDVQYECPNCGEKLWKSEF